MNEKRSFGAIDQLPSGNYRARWREDGKRVTAPMTFASEQDAKNFLLAVEADQLRGKKTPTNTGSVTLAAFSEQWLNEPGKSRNAVARDRQGIKAFADLLPLKLSQIAPDQVQLAATKRSTTVEPSTVRRDYSALRACVNAAVDKRRIPVSPLPRRIALPKVRPTSPPELTDDDLDVLVAEMPDRYGLVALSAGVLALRWSEVIGLRPVDVDFLRKAVTINQTVEEAAGHVRVVSWGKTEQALRSRPVPQFLLDELARYIAKYRPNADPTSLIFVGPRGGILRRSWFGTRYFAPAREAIGLADLDFHHLRHFGITWLVEAGIPPNELKEWFGHKAVDMTMAYTHATSASAREAALKMEERWAKKYAQRSPEQVAH